MAIVRVLVGTKKGAFVMTSDARRDRWRSAVRCSRRCAVSAHRPARPERREPDVCGWCRKHEIDPWNATPRERYYELRGWPAWK